MAISLPIRVALTSIALATIAGGQATTPQKPADHTCPPSSQSSAKSSDKPCTQPADTKQPSTAEQFPFPGEPSKPAASSSDSPDAPAPASSRKSAAEEHPFPSDAPPALPGSDSSSSSSSSSDSSSSADPDAPPPSAPWADQPASTRSNRRKLPKVEKIQSPEDRAAEDLTIAKFYEGRGNLNAAYLRTKDAVQVQPDDPEAHFALAQIAQKMQKREEAIAEFSTYLKLDPDGLNIKAARKALSQLQ
ncbi:MAG TPA: tetratricopeptide repeat protein [Edaphobacter sp.]